MCLLCVLLSVIIMESLGPRNKEKGLYLHAIKFMKGARDLVKLAKESWKQQKRGPGPSCPNIGLSTR